MKVGCNYWASHAEGRMWSQWDEAVIRRDFEWMTEAGVQSVWFFPLQPDFQPHGISDNGSRWNWSRPENREYFTARRNRNGSDSIKRRQNGSSAHGFSGAVID